ncbi:MAG: TlpA family protein disulfide reductase [Parvibaculales bacterium]
MREAPSGKGAGANHAALSDAEGLPAELVVHPTPKQLPEIDFKNAAGETVTLADYRGTVVVLNLWATWCAPCREEMPSLDALQTHFAEAQVTVLALSLDRGKPDYPLAFLADLGVEKLAFGHDPKSRSARALGAFGLPTTLVIDANGKEVARLLGEAEWHTEAVKAFIAGYLP